MLDDPYAERFLGRSRRLLERGCDTRLGERINRRAFSYIAARTRFYDALVESGLDQGLTQVVIVAAGYDCRSWRFARPGARFFEVDHPDTQADKRAQMAELNGEGPTYVPADLSDTSLDGVLYPAGFNPSVPTVFCCEGLTMYLEESAIRELFLSAARIAAPGSRLGVDFALQPLPDERRQQVLVRLVRGFAALSGEPLRYQTRPESAEELLERTGWAVDETLLGQALGERFLQDDAHDWGGSFVASATIRR